MADWRIRKCYGRGAARVVLCPEPYREPASDPSMLSGLVAIGPQLIGGTKSGVVFGSVIIVAFIFTLMRDRTDLSLSEIALWSSPAPAEVVEPPPVVVPPVAPVPKPPDPIIAKRKPKPIPVVKPKPVPIEVAVIPKPKPRSKPKPVPKAVKPKITIAALHAPAVPEPARRSRSRIKTLQPERRKLVPTPTLAISPSRAAIVEPSRERSARRSKPAFKMVQAGTKPKIGTAPAGIAGAAPGSREELDPRRARTRAPASHKASRPRLELAATTSLQLNADLAHASPSRRNRVVANASTSSRRSAVDIGLAPAALASGASSSTPPAAVRIAYRASTSGPARSTEQQTSLQGVSLGSLASCISDREEDLLKQRVLTAVRNRKACVSSKGSYRFVETKNLNAFSMWIERPPGRRASDRCVELSHALACLE